MEQKYINIFPVQRSWRRVYWFHHIRLSVRLWTESSPLCNFHNIILAGPIFISYLHIVSRRCVVCKFSLQNSKFWIFAIFLICNSDFVVIWLGMWHYRDVIMGMMASQITSLTIVYSTVIQAQIKENIKAQRHWPFLWGIHRSPVNSLHKWPVTRTMFPFDDVIMT